MDPPRRPRAHRRAHDGHASRSWWCTTRRSAPSVSCTLRVCRYSSAHSSRAGRSSTAAATQPSSHSPTSAGLRRVQPPGRAVDSHRPPRGPEEVDRRRHGIRPEKTAPGRRASLMVVERRLEDTVSGVERFEVHSPRDGEREQRGGSRGDTCPDDGFRLLAGEHVEERRHRDERCSGEVAVTQMPDIPHARVDRGRVTGRIGCALRGVVEERVVPVVEDPGLRSGQQGSEPPHHRPGPAAQIVHDDRGTGHPRRLPRERPRSRLRVGILTQAQPLHRDRDDVAHRTPASVDAIRSAVSLQRGRLALSRLAASFNRSRRPGSAIHRRSASASACG